MGLTHTSYTRIADFEACPRKAFLKYSEKVPEPPQEDSPLERGTRIHETIERYIRGEIDELPAECEGADPYATDFREALQAEPGTVLQEQLWCFGGHWLPQEAFSSGTRFVAKLDVVQLLDHGLEARICDWKTGRKDGNEVKHADQMMFYTVAAFAWFENLTHVQVLLRYVDHGKDTFKEFTRQEAMQFLPKVEQRIAQVLDEKDFYPKPSLNHCRYCPYKTGKLGKKKNAAIGTGHCNLNPD